jgi:phage shock protein A
MKLLANEICELQKENRTILDDGKAKGDSYHAEMKSLKKDIDELRKENIDLTNEKKQFDDMITELSLRAEKEKEQANKALNLERESRSLEIE